MKNKPFPILGPQFPVLLSMDNQDSSLTVYPCRQTYTYICTVLMLASPLLTNSGILHTTLYLVFLTYLYISEDVPNHYIKKYSLIIMAALYFIEIP